MADLLKPKTPFFLKVLSFLFRVLCILAVDLAVTNLNASVLGLTSHYPKPLVTLLGMFVVLILFFFLVSIIDRFTKYIFKVTIEMGNFLKFRKTVMLLIIMAMYVGVFTLYHKTWFGGWPDPKEVRSSFGLQKLPQIEIKY